MYNDIEELKNLFEEAIALNREQRDAFLSTIRLSRPELASELSSLLISHENTGDSFEPLGLAFDQHHEYTGEHIGPYRIVRKIAEGGMGEVYEAIRDDGVFNKRVAIKLVRHGMSHVDLHRRFELERQTLAKLDHPNIARLLDGGTTSGNVPYLVMEFVEGIRIDEYCDEHKLSIRGRLELFRTVCSAVHYAHQNLIVHRDIKPGNILVTADGSPKLLDFGVAKLISIEKETEAELTRTGAAIFTPEYASPEQAKGESVTTLSDVYSLSVLLYKLLTGQKPYDFKSGLAFEISKTIIDSEPTRPSSKPILIRSEHETAENIGRTLHGDLDAIILMGLRKETDLRYQSVQELSEDIHRYLVSAPVTARRGTARYRFGKFVRRNRIAMIGAGLVVASLLVGLGTTMYQIHVARAEKAKAESVSTFLKRMLSYSNPVHAIPHEKGREVTVKDMLDEAARHVDELSGQEDVKADLERIIAESYGWQGRYELMDQHLLKYIAIQKQLYGANSPRTLNAIAFQGMMAFRNGDMSKSEEIYRGLIPSIKNAYKDGSVDADVLFNTLINFGYLRRTQGDSREAEQAFSDALALSAQLPEDTRYAIPVTRSTLASTLADQGRFSDALQTAEQAVTECRRQENIAMPGFGFALTVLGGFLTEQGDFAEADSALHEAETIFRRLQAPSILWLGDNLRNQAASLYLQGKYLEVQLKISEAIRIYKESFGTHYDHYPTALTIQGLSLSKTGNITEAEKLLREAVRIREESLPRGHFFIALAQSGLGEFLTSQKRYAEAEPLLLESYESLVRSQGTENPRTILARSRVVTLYREWNKTSLAAKYARG